MTTLTATEAKQKFLSLIRKAHQLNSKYTITHNGEPYGVLMSCDEYEGLLETIEILKDKNATKELLKAIREADSGKTLSFQDVVGRNQNK